MKKLISIALIAVMLIVSIPLTAGAAGTDYVWTHEQTITSNVTLARNDSITIPVGAKVTIAPTATIDISLGTVFVNGELINNGTIKGYITFTNPTTGITTDTNFIVNEATGGLVSHRIVLPNSSAASKYSVWSLNPIYAGDPEYSKLWYKFGEGSLYEKVPASGENEMYVPHALPLLLGYRIDSTAGYPSNEPRYSESEAFTASKFNVWFNGNLVDYGNGVFSISRVTTSGKITNSEYDNSLLKTITVALPRTESFVVYALRAGSPIQYFDSVTVTYGETLRFFIELHPDYDRSNYTVAVNNKVVEPNENKVFEIADITNTDANYYKIAVAGVVSNSMQDTMTSIMQFLKEIFETISDIFKTFFEMLNINLG